MYDRNWRHPIMRIGIYPGSFDPVTIGHLDIIKRSALLVDQLIIGVLNNSKKNPVFTAEERKEMIEYVVKDIPNVKVEVFDGLLVEFAKLKKAEVIFRGLRAVTDFEYELQIAQLNRSLYPKLDTMFLAASVEYSYLSSSAVREIASYHGDISMMVPKELISVVENKYKKLQTEEE